MRHTTPPPDSERHYKKDVAPNSAVEIDFDSIQAQLEKILASTAHVP